MTTTSPFSGTFKTQYCKLILLISIGYGNIKISLKLYAKKNRIHARVLILWLYVYRMNRYD